MELALAFRFLEWSWRVPGDRLPDDLLGKDVQNERRDLFQGTTRDVIGNSRKSMTKVKNDTVFLGWIAAGSFWILNKGASYCRVITFTIFWDQCRHTFHIPAHLMLLEFITLIILVEEQKVCSFLQILVPSSLVGPDILISTLFSIALNLRFSLMWET
jgi:hypothetical protein